MSALDHGVAALRLAGSIRQGLTEPELRHLLLQLALELGFPFYIFAQQEPAAAGQNALILNGYPQEWRARYVEASYIRVDPTVVHCLHSTEPLHWSPALANERSAKMWSEAARCGVAHGLSIAAHDPSGHISMLSLARAEPVPEVEENAIASAARAIVCTAHFAALKMKRNRKVMGVLSGLTPRELEVLQWSAAGLTQQQIANRLLITPRAVAWHRGVIYQKLSCKNKAEAIAIAVANGLGGPRKPREDEQQSPHY